MQKSDFYSEKYATLLTAITFLLLSACASPSYKSSFDNGLVNPFSQINVGQEDARLRVKLQIDALSGYQKDKIENFFKNFKNQTIIKKMIIAMPLYEEENKTFTRTKKEIEQIIEKTFIMEDQFEWKYYSINKSITPEIVVTYSYYKKYVNGCGHGNGTPASWLGCATYQNILAMVDDPRDLIRPAEFDKPTAETAIQALSKSGSAK